MAVLRLPPIPQGEISTNPQEWRSWAIQLQEQLEYGFGHIETGNFTEKARKELENAQKAAEAIGKTLENLKFSSSIYLAQQLADKLDGNLTIHYSATEPEEKALYDIWYDESTIPPKVWRWTGFQWSDITSNPIGTLLTLAKDANALADGKIRTFYMETDPRETETVDIGDLWFDSGDNNFLRRYDGTDWVPAQNNALGNIYTDNDGLHLKSIEGGYEAVLKATALEFYQGGAWICEFSNYGLTTASGNFYDRITIGTTTKGFYDLTVIKQDSNSILMLDYRSE
ncbi:MAG TPA: hypothetical protein P5244_03115 [Syntrophales bacterium]|nr:hypothetical protein [Syntrophales bacterium]HRV28383.1 hypothetical protein [Spirochaetia bacterium]